MKDINGHMDRPVLGENIFSLPRFLSGFRFAAVI